MSKAETSRALGMEILQSKMPLQAVLWGENAHHEGAEKQQKTANSGGIKREKERGHMSESETDIRPLLDGAQGKCSTENRTHDGGVRAVTAQNAM